MPGPWDSYSSAGAAPAEADAPRGVRNNNPLNIRRTDIDWQGETAGADEAFETFESPEAGYRAAYKNLQSYQERGLNTPRQIISTWAPPSENPTEDYIQRVSERTGVAPDQPINLDDPDAAADFMSAMEEVELGGQYYGRDVAKRGIQMAQGGGQAQAAEAPQDGPWTQFQSGQEAAPAAGGDGPWTQFQGGQESAEQPTQQPAEEGQGAWYTDPVYSAARGLSRGFTSIPQAAGIAQSYLTGQDARETALYEAGAEAQEAVEEALPLRRPDENERFFWSQQLPNAIGQMASFFVPATGAARVGAGAARLAGAGAKGTQRAARAAGISTGTAMGSAQVAHEGFQDALREGAEISDAMEAAGWGAIIGTSEFVPIGRALDRLDSATGGKVKRTLMSAAKMGTEEAAQEVGQTIAQNLVASDIVEYDPDRGTFQMATEAGEIGFSAGALMGAVGGLVGGRRMAQESGFPLKEDEEAAAAAGEQPAGEAAEGEQAREEQPAAAPEGAQRAGAGAEPGAAPAPQPVGDGSPEAPLRQITREQVQMWQDRINQAPTEGQKAAGNYAKLHGKIQGLDVAIENAEGQVRRGKDKDGKEWEARLPANYGYIKGTKARDGDAVDTFIGPQPDSGRAFVIDQQDPETKQFDEPKVMLGFPDRDSAIRTYQDAFTDERGADRIQSVTETTTEEVRNVLGQRPTFNEPFADVFEGTAPSDVTISTRARDLGIVDELSQGITEEMSFAEAEKQFGEQFDAIEQSTLEEGRPQQARTAKRRLFDMVQSGALAPDRGPDITQQQRQAGAAQPATGAGLQQPAAGERAAAAPAAGAAAGRADTEVADLERGLPEVTPQREPAEGQAVEANQRNLRQGRVKSIDMDAYLPADQAAQSYQGLPTDTDYGRQLVDMGGFQFPSHERPGLEYTNVRGEPAQADPSRPYGLVRYDAENPSEQYFASAREAINAAPSAGEFQVLNMITGEVVAEPSLENPNKVRVYKPSAEPDAEAGQPLYSETPSGRGEQRGRQEPDRGREAGADTGRPEADTAAVRRPGRRYRRVPQERDQAERVAGAEVQQVFEFEDGRNVYEVSEPGEQWTQRIERAKEQLGPVGAQVSSEVGDRLFLFDDGNSGFALDGDNIISVFSTPDSPAGVLRRVMEVALGEGGQRLDAFDTFLPQAYAKHGGFKTVARLGFNPQFAPDGWNYEYFQEKHGTGQPDVAFMVHDPENAQAEGGQRVDDYDEGVRLQREALEEISQRGALYSATPLRRGEEVLEQYGLERPDADKPVKVQQIVKALNRRQREKYGQTDLKDFSPEAADKLANWMAEEVAFEAGMPAAKSGFGWYTKKYKSALNQIGRELFPEFRSKAALEGTPFKTTKEAREYFTAILAVTSNGTNARDNFRTAAAFYQSARQDGQVKMERGTRRGATGQHLETLNNLVRQYGVAGARNRLLEESTVGEINARQRAATGKNAIANYPASMTVPNAAGYWGPKLGAFYANLMGKDGYLTMDLWWTRTINRYRGQLETRASDKGVSRVAELVAKEERLNVKPEDMSRDDVIAKALPYEESYRKKGYKDGTELEAAANTLIRYEFGTREQPMGSNDRGFMVDVAERAQEKLQQSGIDASISDIQAAAWFFEKRLYRAVGGRERGDISYAEAARDLATEWAGRDVASDARGAVEGDVQRRDEFWSATPAPEGRRVRAGRERAGGRLPAQDTREQQAEDQGRANVGGDFGSGLGYRDFFAQAAAGQHAPAKLDEKGYERLIDLSSIDSFVQEYQRHRGNFDDHIMTSIPAFGDIQPNVGNAIVKTFEGEDATMLDIGASEGALIKAISKQSNGRIKTVGVDPNPQMAREQAEISTVRGMTYRQDAFGTAEQAGEVAWVEDDGTPIYYYDPKGQQFDVVHEAMVFQFISNERESQLRRAKEVMKDDGLLIVEEKHVPDEGQTETWEKNEKQKDRFKEQYYTKEQLQQKKKQVLEGQTEEKTRDQIAREEEGVMGMHDLMVPSKEMERILSNEFRHVVQFWDSGNFKGYVATNDDAKLQQFLGNLVDTNTDYSTVQTPRTVQSHAGPAFTSTERFDKRRIKMRKRIQDIADRLTDGRAQIDFKPKIIARDGSVRDSGGEVGETAAAYAVPDQWLIGLAMEDPRFDPRNEVGHEAFHLLEYNGFFTPEEMSVLEANEGFLRAEAAKEFRLPVDNKLVRDLAPWEVRAIAFARYRRLKDQQAPMDRGWLPAIRRAFNRIRLFLDQVRSALRKEGFITVESVFEDVRTGVLARRGSVDIENSFTGPELYSDRENAPGFYSKLRVGMENVDTDVMKGNGWLQQISKLKKQGVKDEELEWSGLEEWLEENKGTKLSKQQVLDFIDANTIEIKELEYSDAAPPEPEEYESDLTEQHIGNQGEFEEVYAFDDEVTGETFTAVLDTDAGNVRVAPDGKDFIPVPGDLNAQDLEDAKDAIETELERRHGLPWQRARAVIRQASWSGRWPTERVGLNMINTINAALDPNDTRVQKIRQVLKNNSLDQTDWGAEIIGALDAWGEMASARLRGEPQYGRYATPGGENYREVLLTAPKLEDTYRSDHWDDRNVLAHVRLQDFESPAGEQVLMVEEIQSDWHQQGREQGYKPPEKEIRAQAQQYEAEAEEYLMKAVDNIRNSENGAEWIDWLKQTYYRMPDEARSMLGDPETKAGMALLAEYAWNNPDAFKNVLTRSDEGGSNPVPAPPGYTDRPGEMPYYRTHARVDWATSQLRRKVTEALRQDYRGARQNQDRARMAIAEGIPQAPFKRSWPELALKRVLRLAAEGGYDRVAWTIGAQQADRYSLRHRVSHIMFDKTRGPEGGGYLSAFRKGDKARVLNERLNSIDEAAQYIGQEATERLKASENNRLEGEDLETGGEGMKAFYDKMLPNFAKKYVKKWGAKVEQSTIRLQQPPSDQLSGLGREMAEEAGPQTMQVWSVPVTEDMREAVLNTGQPLYSATRTIPDDAPASRRYAERVIAEPGTNAVWKSVKEIFRSDATFPGKFRHAFNFLRETYRIRAMQGVFDQYYSIKDRERRARGGIDFKRSGWVASLMTNDIGSVMANVFGEKYGGEWQGGALKYSPKDGAFTLDTSVKPLFQILEPLKQAGRLNQWQMWTIAKRTKRIIEEDAAYNAANPDKKPRDRDAVFAKLAEAEGRDRMDILNEIIEEGNKHPEFQQALDDWSTLNGKMLDMAQQAGLIDPDQRAIWEKNDYVPFYRVIEELGGDMISGPSQRAGLVNQDAQIRALRGGEAPVNDIIENMALNMTHLVQSSMKNVAAQKSVPVLLATEDIEKVPYKARPQHVSMEEARKALERSGINVEGMTDEQAQEYFTVFQMVPPKGRDVFSVMVDGKPQYYRVNDPTLFNALTSMGIDRPQGWMRLLAYPKKLLTEFVTADPAFAIANGMRDSIQTWLITGEKFTPVKDSAKGMRKAWKRNASMRAIMAGGGGGGGFYSFASQDVRKQMEQHDPRSIIDSPAKAMFALKRLYRAYDRLLNTTEMANRISIYDQVKARGGSEAEAIFQAKDVMNFTMRGDWSIVRALVHTVPFLNARLQGLYRLGRGAKENPRSFWLRGSILTGMTMALWALNYDDEEYQDLSEFDKDMYYHLLLENVFGKAALDEMGIPSWMRHLRIPKPFEVGAIFSTLPERSANYMLGTDDGKVAAERMSHMVLSTFSLNPVPQAALPVIEQWANKSFFMDTHIVSPYDVDMPPESQYGAGTSETARAIGGAIGYSPERVEHYVRGYFGSIGMYLLDASDMAVRGVGGYESAPVTRPDEMPVIGRFFRGDPAKYTKWLSEFYDTKREVDGIYAAIQQARERNNMERAERLRKGNAELLRMRPMLSDMNQQLRKLNDRMARIHFDKEMDPKEKRERLDQVYERRNKLVKRLEGHLRDVIVEGGEVRESPYADNEGGSWLSMFTDALAKGDADRVRVVAQEAEKAGVQIDSAEAARTSGHNAMANIVEKAPAGTGERIDQALE